MVTKIYLFFTNGIHFIARTTTGIERSRLGYLPLLWPVPQSGADVEHNDIILTLGLPSKQHIAYTPTSHVSLLYSDH